MTGGEAQQGDRRARGREAEAIAAEFLVREGFEILDRNHGTPRGEVDLVCREGGIVCFVEVRSRSSDAQGGPEETVGRGKARRVVAAATDWALRNGGLEQELRFDVVAVTFEEAGPRVELYRGAFDGEGKPGLW
ncbi:MULTISPECIES: YraN family protein [Anaeromyxobacter]|uniref:YraN family protein n=1 Tax=Anaeromyxobacter TaxID=161492 RepID=UPI001F56186C|nr:MULTISPECIES: YraN family protein [unclassified Anaeromyxobacter]